MHHLWPFGRGIIVVGLHVDPVKRGDEPEPATLLFTFQNEKPDDVSLRSFFATCDITSATDLDAAISTKWVPVFNFNVPHLWIGRSVMEVARQEEVIVWGIRRPSNGGSLAIWFPGPGLKDEVGNEKYVEKFGESDEVILPFWSARAFAQKYQRFSIPLHPVVIPPVGAPPCPGTSIMGI